MTDAAIEAPRFRLKIIPLIAVVVLGLGIPVLGASAAILTAKLLHWQITPGANPPWLYLQHFYQTAFAIVAIVALKYTLVPADYGMHLPRGKTYVWPAIGWGIFFGLLMTVVDYAPQLIAHTKPDAGYPLTPQNVWSWLFFEGIYVGPTEEIPFRALLVTFLIATMPGKFRIGRYEMSWAGVLVALIFALAHATNFSARAWPEALGQQFYAFALGVLYAYWLEKSKSVLAPAIGHNVGDVVETAIMMAWIAFW